MKFLGIMFVFSGYVLVYASTAAGGKFATEPWAGLFADAYTGAQTNPQAESTDTGNNPLINPRARPTLTITGNPIPVPQAEFTNPTSG